jgi:lipopolysaccharide transport system ATP-binding protein
MAGNAIEAHGLSKSYRVYGRPAHRLLEAIDRRPRHQVFRALTDVTFAIPEGEGLGIIGENGAGKSTLLKILYGVTRPTSGSHRVAGKVAGILELGAGFHPEFSGRKNAVLNAALLGLSQREVEAALPRIVDFSELGDFIDRPVKTYSTGMAMRLAFSIATQVEPQVLIVDEALSVGDGYFQKKCMDRLLAFIQGGGTVLFCSHAMYYVTSLCKHALWLKGGRAERFGPALDVVHAYEDHLLARGARPPAALPAPEANGAVEGAGPARLLGVRWLPDSQPVDEALRSFRSGDRLEIEIEWESTSATAGFHLGVGIDRSDGVQVCSFATHQDDEAALRGLGRHRLRLAVDSLPLLRGEFALYVFLLDEAGLHVYDRAVTHGAFRVEAGEYRIGLVTVPHRWEADQAVAIGPSPSGAAASRP